MALDSDDVFILVEEDSGAAIVSSGGISGFFLDPCGETSDVRFSGASFSRKPGFRAEDAVLEVVDSRGEIFGRYYIGRIKILGEAFDRERRDVIVDFFGNFCDYPRAGEIWRSWASSRVESSGEWARWPVEYHEAWLHVVQNSWFASGKWAARYGNKRFIEIDGNLIKSKSTLYLLIGEEVNGPGGYFGSNLDALADSLSSNFGDGVISKVIWENFEKASECLDSDFVSSLNSVFLSFGVEVEY